MLCRRLLQSSIPVSSSSSLFLRSFTSSVPLRRAPNIGDITHDGADEFNTRQKEFRENVEAARKQKEQQDSQSLAASSKSSSTLTPTSSSSPTAQDASNASGDDPSQGLGSLSTHRSTEEARHTQTEGGSSKRGALSSLIYGTHEGQQMDKDMEKSFSQVLARGKYVHSIVFHEVKPDKIDEYVETVGNWYPKVAAEPANKVNLVGSFRTEVGDCDTFGMYPFAHFSRRCRVLC